MNIICYTFYTLVELHQSYLESILQSISQEIHFVTVKPCLLFLKDVDSCLHSNKRWCELENAPDKSYELKENTNIFYRTIFLFPR